MNFIYSIYMEYVYNLTLKIWTHLIVKFLNLLVKLFIYMYICMDVYIYTYICSHSIFSVTFLFLHLLSFPELLHSDKWHLWAASCPCLPVGDNRSAQLFIIQTGKRELFKRTCSLLLTLPKQSSSVPFNCS